MSRKINYKNMQLRQPKDLETHTFYHGKPLEKMLNKTLLIISGIPERVEGLDNNKKCLLLKKFESVSSSYCVALIKRQCNNTLITNAIHGHLSHLLAMGKNC